MVDLGKSPHIMVTGRNEHFGMVATCLTYRGKLLAGYPRTKTSVMLQNRTIISSRSLNYLRFFLLGIQRCTFVSAVANYCIRTSNYHPDDW